jgi:hypothetical protein
MKTKRRLLNKIAHEKGRGVFTIGIKNFGQCDNMQDILFGIVKSIKDEISDRINEDLAPFYTIDCIATISYDSIPSIQLTINEKYIVIYFDLEYESRVFSFWYNNHKKSNAIGSEFYINTENLFDIIVRDIVSDVVSSVVQKGKGKQNEN